MIVGETNWEPVHAFNSQWRQSAHKPGRLPLPVLTRYLTQSWSLLLCQMEKWSKPYQPSTPPPGGSAASLCVCVCLHFCLILVCNNSGKKPHDAQVKMLQFFCWRARFKKKKQISNLLLTMTPEKSKNDFNKNWNKTQWSGCIMYLSFPLYYLMHTV